MRIIIVAALVAASFVSVPTSGQPVTEVGPVDDALEALGQLLEGGPGGGGKCSATCVGVFAGPTQCSTECNAPDRACCFCTEEGVLGSQASCGCYTDCPN